MKLLPLMSLLSLSTAGAANLSAAADLELIRAHLYASVTTYAGGSLQWGKKHAGHSLEELWAHLSPQVAAGQRPAFEAGLKAIQVGPGTLAPGAYEETVNRFLSGPWAAAWTAASTGAGADFEVSLTTSLLTNARSDYAAAMAGGTLSNPGEQQDAVGFLNRALVHGAKVSPQGAQGIEELQILLLNGAAADVFGARVEQVRAEFQAQHNDAGTERRRLLELSLKATREEYVGEGEVDEGLASLADVDGQWSLLRTALGARNAPLVQEFSAALIKLRATLVANDTEAFKVAHITALDVWQRIKAARP
ncbi:hypothetical protein [Deinococcus koreensis]|uniref:Uncharacterized protein n=1 Tax=Deinococcus koreensis TaxID=2054903 RepID=A0A2K3US60_9DEIO|nr:hypothetical protein [Deinococcus koreensis]PNY79375.1 hypothetical protein CVO96_19835 [Deinococcus koreensis]